MKRYKEERDEWSSKFEQKRKNKNAKKIKRTKPRKSGSWE
jgi:hypothetical protein